MKDKREILAKALEAFEQDWCIPREDMFKDFSGINYDALAKQAIVIECGVEHTKLKDGDWITDVSANLYPSPGCSYRQIMYSMPGIHGTPGKALAIIVPLADE